jgi:hypothetical protein
MTDTETEQDGNAELQSLEVICAIGDAAVRALEEMLGEQPSIPYDEAAKERQAEIEAGVRFILDKPASSYAAQHDAWRARNVQRLDRDDPRLVKFDQLPFGQQLKARLWRHIVHAVIG